MSSSQTQTFRVQVRRVLRNVPESQFSSLPNTPGAYMITVRSGRRDKRYVGSSKTLRTRVIAHREPKDPNILGMSMESVCVYLTDTHVDARILEGWLIREVRPELNKSPALRSGNISSRCEDCDRGEDETGCCEQIDVKVRHVTQELSPDAVRRLPSAPGAYVITTGSGQQYVGSSKSLRHRAPAPHDNVTEAIQTICCHETEHEEDALILEYGLIRELEPQLNREFQPDASTWKTHPRSKPPPMLVSASSEVCVLFDALSTRLRGLDDVTEVVRKKWVTYQFSALKNFCTIRVLRSGLRVDIKVDEQRFHDPVGVFERIKPTQVWNFHRKTVVMYAHQVEPVFALVKQAASFLKS